MGCIISRLIFPQPHGALDKEGVAHAGGVCHAVPCAANATTLSVLVFKGDRVSPTVLFSHGNGYDLSTTWPLASRLRDITGCTVVAYDYTGYGEAPQPSRATTARRVEHDIMAVYGFVTRTLGSARVVLMGHSIGCGPTCYLAACGRHLDDSRTIVGVVLVSAFTSVLDIARPHVPRCLLCPCLEAFPNQQRCRDVTCPVLFIHGTRDVLVPHSHATALADTLERRGTPTRVVLVRGATHNDTLALHDEQVMTSLQDFVNGRQ